MVCGVDIISGRSLNRRLLVGGLQHFQCHILPHHIDQYVRQLVVSVKAKLKSNV